MIFTIKKYKQTSNNLLYKLLDFLHFKKRLSYLVNFTNAPKYVNKKNIHVRTINRLFGLTNGYHKSINFGWEYMHREIYVYVYHHYKGKTVNKFMRRIDFDKEYIFTIHSKKTHYLFTIIDSNYNIKQYKIEIPSINYKLYPKLNNYNIALNDINIELIDN